MPITCPNGHVNDEGNRFCDQCGAPLSAGPAPAAEASSPAMPPANSTGTSSVACPTCGQENLPGTAFCENCGAPLQPPEPTAASEAASIGAPAAPAGDGSVTCANCGTANDPSNTFCDQCGASLSTTTADSVPEAAPTEMPDEAGTAGVAMPAPALDAQPADAAAPATDGTAEEQPPVLPEPMGEEEAPVSPPAPAEAPAAPAPLEIAAPVMESPLPAPSGTAELPPAQAPAADTDVSAPPEISAPADAPVPPPVAAASEAPAQPVAQQENCPNCGATLPPNAKFCMECGTKIERQPQMVRPTHCQNCGAEVPPNAKFCLECGAKVELIPAGSEKQPSQPVEATYQQQANTGAPLPSALDIAMQRSAAPAPAGQLDQAASEPAAQPAQAGQPAAQVYDAAAAAGAAAPVASPPQAPAPSAQPAMPAPQAAAGGGPRLLGRDGSVISLPPKNELVIGREDPISGIHPDVDLTAHGGEAGGVSRRHAILRQQGGQWTVTDLDSTNYTRIDGNRVAPNTATPVHDGARLQFGRVEFEFRAQ